MGSVSMNLMCYITVAEQQDKATQHSDNIPVAGNRHSILSVHVKYGNSVYGFSRFFVYPYCSMRHGE